MMDFDFKQKIDAEENARQKLAEEQSKPRRSFYIIGFMLAAFFVFSVTMVITGDSSESWLGRLPFIGRLFGASADKTLMGEEEDRVNILLLGMGGKNHDGAYLTDTIILASLKPSTKKVVLFSIPRDLSIPVGGRWQKINSINAYAENKGEEGGLATSQALSEILEMPIHYYIRVDFEGFMNIIDELGGVEVDVENTLDDYQYPAWGQEDNPNYNARYEHLHIDTGLQTMDGMLALKYARSRHALGKEGSDFARSRRQQKILSAVKDKMLSSENLLKPGMLARIIEQLNEHVAMSINIWEGLRFWDLFKDISKDDIVSQVLDDAPTGLLRSSQGVDGAYILLPKTGNFGEIKSLMQNIFLTPALNTAANDESLKISEPATVEIKNGTQINGLAGETGDKLKTANFVVTRISNASQRDFKQAVIYDFTYGEKEAALKILQIKAGAIISQEVPEWLTAEIKADIKANPSQVRPDFLLIVGENNKQ